MDHYIKQMTAFASRTAQVNQFPQTLRKGKGAFLSITSIELHIKYIRYSSSSIDDDCYMYMGAIDI